MSEKLFVGLDEEIIFLTEKIKESENDEFILVIPEKAALLGSSVSLKLLFSEIAKLKKKALIVTKDDIGLSLAEKAGFLAVKNVSEIDDQSWEEAEVRVRKYLEKREKKKEKLIQERNESTSSKTKVKEDQQEKVKKKEEASKKKKETTVKKTKITPKKVELGGFEMVAGGDIADFAKEEKEKPDLSDNVEKKSQPSKDKSKRQKESLVGRDLSTYSYTSLAKKQEGEGKSENKKKKKIKKDSQVKKSLQKVKDAVLAFFTSGGNKPKFLIGGVLVIIAFFALSYFVFPRGEVVIKVESRDINLQKQVTADTSASSLDLDNLTIPASQIKVQDDLSRTADATGKEETGETASGTVVIYNLTESEVVVNSGTILEELESGNKYKTSTEVTVPAKKPDDDPDNPGLIGNVEVGIQANDFGEDYNISGSKKKFRVTGFDLENLYAKNFVDVTGGTSEEVKVVSEEDKQNLKKDLKQELETTLNEQLEAEAGTTREVLLDTVEYEELLVQASPDVGAEADSFNLTVTLKATVLSFSKEDIDLLAQQLVEQENQQQVDVEKFEYNSNVINAEGSKIDIKLSITGVVTPSISEDEIQVELAGKNRSSAEDYLGSQNEIKEYEIDLYPSWLPGFLKHFPTSTNRIKVDIKKISIEN